jgi:hypothetical protein
LEVKPTRRDDVRERRKELDGNSCEAQATRALLSDMGIFLKRKLIN